MNSRQRRYQRRILNMAISSHKRGDRGTWMYSRRRKGFPYEITIWDDWIGVYSTSKNIYKDGLIVAYHTNFPKWAKTLSFLSPVINDKDLCEYPAYKLKGTGFFLVPSGYESEIKWVTKIALKSGRARLLDTSFHDVFLSMNDEQKAEAVWNLDVLTEEYNV
jgi:hypothetical protein